MNVKAGLTFCRHLGYRAMWQAKKHAPEICLAIGGIAGVGCLVTACRSTLKMEPILEHHNKVLKETKEIIEKQPDKFTPTQQKRMVAGVYASTAIQLGKLYAQCTQHHVWISRPQQQKCHSVRSPCCCRTQNPGVRGRSYAA